MYLHRSMEVMKAGYLRKNISTNTHKKQYKEFYFVLKRDRENSSKKTLEYFKDENSSLKNEPEGVCNLYSQYNVDIKLKEKRKLIFEIVDVGKSHELMTTDETTGKEWVKLLTEGLVIQIFSVIKMSYPPAAQNYVKDMKGTVLLKIDESGVTLLSNNGPAIYWKFSVITKCKKNNGLVILEVGKKSITGEGEFYFDTFDPKRLYHVLDRAVKERAKQREILPNTNATEDYTLTENRLNSHRIDNKCDTNEINKTGKVKPNDSTYDHLSNVPDHLAEPSKPPPSSKKAYDLLFFSTRMETQRRYDPQTAPMLNMAKLLSDKTKIPSSAVNNPETNKTDKTKNVEPNDSTYDHLLHAPNHLAKPSTPPPSSSITYDSLFSSTRMATQRKSDPQVAHVLNITKLLSDKDKITLSAVNNHDTNKTDKTENVRPNLLTYDHLSHVANHFAKPSAPPSSSKITYDSLFSSTRMATQLQSDPQIAPFLNNRKLLNGKTKITSSAINNHDTNKTDKTENVEPNHSIYDHLSNVSDHLAKPSTPPLSSKNTYDSLFSSTRMATQPQSDPQIAPFLNNRKLLNDKTKITSSAVNNHGTNKTDKAENVETDHSTYDHLSHVPDHLAKPMTPAPSSKNTYDSLFSSTRMVTQQKSDPQIVPFLNNTKLLSCKTVAPSAVTPPATPTILENMYVQMDLCQTSEIKKPIPLSLRNRPATALQSTGLSLNSEMHRNDNFPVGKFINSTLQPKEESTGVLNTKNTSTCNSDICDDNMYEVIKEPCKLSNNNNKENRKSSPNEYNHLFEHPTKEVPNKLLEYNHLKRNSTPTPLARTNKFGVQVSPVPPFKNKRKPLCPVRPPPLTRPLQKQRQTCEIPRTIMDTLDYRYAGYKKVGDIILRESQVKITDTDRYMEVPLLPKPHSIYNVPIE